MDKKIILLSNSEDYNTKNSLTHFQSYINEIDYLPDHIYCQISTEYVGFHGCFKNQITSKNNIHPAIIAINIHDLFLHLDLPLETETFVNNKIIVDNDDTREKRLFKMISLKSNTMSLLDFEDHEKFYLQDTESYNAETINEQFSKKISFVIKNEVRNYRGFPSKVSSSSNTLEFSQFRFPFDQFDSNERWKIRTVLFFHEKFVDSFNEQNSLAMFTKIDGEKYYWYYNKENAPTLKISFNKEKLKVKVPKIVKVVSKEIEPLLTQEGFSNIIALFAINPLDVNKYIHKNFSNREFFQLDFRHKNHFEIELLDERDCRLELSEGLPSIVKFHAIESNMNQFHVRVNSKSTQSYPNNRPNQFEVKLAKSLYLPGSWEVALSSIIFHNVLQTTKELNLKYNVTFYNKEGTPTLIKYFNVPTNLTSANEIVNFFTYTLSDFIEVKVDENEKLSLKFKMDLSLEIQKHLSKLLGFSHISEKAVIKKKKNEEFNTLYSICEIPLFASNLFLHSNIIDYSVLGHAMGKVLKIVHVPESSSSIKKYESLEFDNLEFITITYTEVQHLRFELRSHTGSLVEFRNDRFSGVYLNLIFRQKESI